MVRFGAKKVEGIPPFLFTTLPKNPFSTLYFGILVKRIQKTTELYLSSEI